MDGGNAWKAQAIKLYLDLPLTSNHPNSCKSLLPGMQNSYTPRKAVTPVRIFFSYNKIWTSTLNAVVFLLGAEHSEEQEVSSVWQEEWLARTASLA